MLGPRSRASLLAFVFALNPACGDDSTTGGAPLGGAGGSGAGASGGGGAPLVGGMGGAGGAAPNPSQICEDLGLPITPFDDGVPGVHRGELAGDFQLPLLDGTTFSFREQFSGCESYLFLPDTVPVSETDNTLVWEHDLDDLVAASPRNVHYFFISIRDNDTGVANLVAMQERVNALLATMSEEDRAHWQSRLHVVQAPIPTLDNWIGDVGSTIGQIGFGIDREQRVRGVGFLADVHRYSAALESGGHWPWKSNLAMLANEANYFEANEARRVALAQTDSTVIPVFEGEVLAEFAEKDITLPDAATIAGFDTLEIEVEQACPNPDDIEFNNCGAWDYIATLKLDDHEIARFITSYHRETHWVVDATPMLAFMQSGGAHHLRWDFAPSWNTQPTATKLSLRFSNKNVGVRPVAAIPLWAGGPFDSQYEVNHPAIDVPIPLTAKKVGLYTIVTGHGASTNQCSEFCNHQHELSVGGGTFLKEFPMAGTLDKCVPELEHGMVPNQGGTWWFGRGGWCPGQQVSPWVEDITELVTPGADATISYRGLYHNVAPPPDGSGDIALSSYLVIYE
ncbi:MAG: peptide-N-glycosidase F-related protein [Polyangiaceae bacterium]